MKIQISLTLILLFLATTILQIGAVSQLRDSDLIEKTCTSSPFYRLCIQIIKSDPESASKDEAGLALIVVDDIERKSKAIIGNCDKLLEKSTELQVHALKGCKRVYTTVLEVNVPLVHRSLPESPRFAEDAVAHTNAQAAHCEALLLAVGEPSPLTKQNNYMAAAADVARAIIRNLL